jgi:sulfatase maturation enzyme AslB (radical SAM superfamily)
MTYVVQQPVNDGVLLYNTLTCSLVLLTPDEAADITAQQELIERWFLVPQEHDDQKFCRQVRQMAALLKPVAKAITGYTILTTTGCNARCFYCFEKGTKPVTMTAETADKVVRYIVKHRGDEKVQIRWFGGEPLVNAKVIDQICTELREQDVPFRSTMISNGYLFDADKVQRAKDLWQLQQVQITLDGMEQTYNRVKAYVHQGVNAFERVLQNIAMLTAAGIRVSIRLNVDKHNIGEMT